MISIETLQEPNFWELQICDMAARLSHRQNLDKKVLPTKLLSLLIKIGDDHAKAVRGLDVKYWLKAPRYFWHEFVTYRVGNEQLGSESTMHSAPKFETEEEFIKWKENLLEGTMQVRIFKTSYQTLRHMYFARRNHRLPEWRQFCAWIETLPWAKELITVETHFDSYGK